jgi:uncharacterized protein YcnI
MPSNEYLSFKEWTVEVEKLCQARLKCQVWDTGIKFAEAEDAWQDGATPEEFYETDVTDALLQAQKSQGGAK